MWKCPTPLYEGQEFLIRYNMVFVTIKDYFRSEVITTRDVLTYCVALIIDKIFQCNRSIED